MEKATLSVQELAAQLGISLPKAYELVNFFFLCDRKTLFYYIINSINQQKSSSYEKEITFVDDCGFDGCNFVGSSSEGRPVGCSL